MWPAGGGEGSNAKFTRGTADSLAWRKELVYSRVDRHLRL